MGILRFNSIVGLNIFKMIMDINTTNFFSVGGFLMSAGGIIYALFKHKEIKKRCFGKTVKISIADESRRDIEEGENESTETKTSKG